MDTCFDLAVRIYPRRIPLALIFRSALLIAVVSTTAGCWSDNGLGMVKVSGTITFDGGPPPADGRVGFSPIEPAPGLPSRTGRATFSEDGRFVVTSFDEGDGLVPGRYGVKVVCLSGRLGETMSQAQIDKISHVPSGFKPEELVIEPGSRSITYDIDVPAK